MAQQPKVPILDPALEFSAIPTDAETRDLYEERRQAAEKLQQSNETMKRKMLKQSPMHRFFGTQLGGAPATALAAGGLVFVASPSWAQRGKAPYCTGRTSLIVLAVVMVVVFVLTYFGPDLYNLVRRLL